jgi:FkbM family methyltransferase
MTKAPLAQRLRNASALRRLPLWRVLRRPYELYLRRRFKAGIPTVINGEPIRLRHDCRWVGKWDSSAGYKVYEPQLWKALAADLRPTDIVADVGANVGVHAVACARLVREGTVYAFEPDPRNADALRDHARMNGVAARMQVVESAVGAEPGTVMFAAAGSLMSSVGNLWDADATDLRPVPVVTLDDVLEDGVDVLKIDVEGYEGEVLAGARGLLADSRKRPRVIYLEVHLALLDRTNHSPDELRGTLQAAGYHVEPVDPARVGDIEQWVARSTS